MSKKNRSQSQVSHPGRGAQHNPPNRFDQAHRVREHVEGLDLPVEAAGRTQFIEEQPRQVLNRVDSPDIPFNWSINPYQGCEHGCAYCYARNSHQYWGYSAGLDFERRIVVKRSAPSLLEQRFRDPRWEVEPIMLSGNTDCYQPAERSYRITRRLLEVFVRYRHPVGIITKNSLLLRDLDLLEDLATERLVQVVVSINTLDEDIRRVLEPRTASARKRLDMIGELHQAGIPVMAMLAPVVPALTDHDIPEVLAACADAGASDAAFILLRLNGELPGIFEAWLDAHFPDRKQKVLSRLASCRGGRLGDTTWGRRMKGEGPVAEAIRQLFHSARRKYLPNAGLPEYNIEAFRRPGGRQLPLFRA